MLLTLLLRLHGWVPRYRCRWTQATSLNCCFNQVITKKFDLAQILWLSVIEFWFPGPQNENL